MGRAHVSPVLGCFVLGCYMDVGSHPSFGGRSVGLRCGPASSRGIPHPLEVLEATSYANFCGRSWQPVGMIVSSDGRFVNPTTATSAFYCVFKLVKRPGVGEVFVRLHPLQSHPSSRQMRTPSLIPAPFLPGIHISIAALTPSLELPPPRLSLLTTPSLRQPDLSLPAWPHPCVRMTFNLT